MISRINSIKDSHIEIINRKASDLKSEKDDGYIEYKWKLINIPRDRLIKLITQMNYRLNEGDGKSIYAIGFLDNGKSIGINYNDLYDTLETIISIASEVDAVIQKILIFKEDNSYCAKIFLIKN